MSTVARAELARGVEGRELYRVTDIFVDRALDRVTEGIRPDVFFVIEAFDYKDGLVVTNQDICGPELPLYAIHRTILLTPGNTRRYRFIVDEQGQYYQWQMRDIDGNLAPNSQREYWPMQQIVEVTSTIQSILSDPNFSPRVVLR